MYRDLRHLGSRGFVVNSYPSPSNAPNDGAEQFLSARSSKCRCHHGSGSSRCIPQSSSSSRTRCCCACARSIWWRTRVLHSVEAVDADEAVAILKSRSDIALLFTDIQMPGSMDGLKLAPRGARALAADQDHPGFRAIAAGRTSIFPLTAAFSANRSRPSHDRRDAESDRCAPEIGFVIGNGATSFQQARQN